MDPPLSRHDGVGAPVSWIITLLSALTCAFPACREAPSPQPPAPRVVRPVVAPPPDTTSAPEPEEVEDNRSPIDVETPEEITAALCEQACEHALALTLEALPLEARREIGPAMKKTMDADCPRDCLERATPTSVMCILAAESAVALARCR